MKIRDMNISARAKSCLLRAGYLVSSEIKDLSDDDLLSIKNLNQNCVDEIRLDLESDDEVLELIGSKKEPEDKTKNEKQHIERTIYDNTNEIEDSTKDEDTDIWNWSEGVDEDEDPFDIKVDFSCEIHDEEEDIDYSRVKYEEIYKKLVELDPGIEPLVNRLKNINAPQYGEVDDLIQKMHAGNKSARERVISMYLRSAMKIALRMSELYDYDIQDAISCGIIGLVNGVDKYYQNSSFVFHSYISMYIRQSIQRGCNPKWIDFYYSVHAQEKFQLLLSVFRKRDNVSVMDVAKELNWSEETVIKWIEMLASQMSGKYSLEEVIEQVDIEEENVDTNKSFNILRDKSIDYVDLTSDYAAFLMLKDQLDKILDSLTEREQKVLRLRFGLYDGRQHTLEEVGKEFNVTRERIRQIEAKALRKLRHPSRSKQVKDYYPEDVMPFGTIGESYKMVGAYYLDPSEDVSNDLCHASKEEYEEKYSGYDSLISCYESISHTHIQFWDDDEFYEEDDDEFEDIEIYDEDDEISLTLEFCGIEFDRNNKTLTLKFDVDNICSDDQHNLWAQFIYINSELYRKFIKICEIEDGDYKLVELELSDFDDISYSSIKDISFSVEIDDEDDEELDNSKTLYIECDTRKETFKVTKIEEFEYHEEEDAGYDEDDEEIEDSNTLFIECNTDKEPFNVNRIEKFESDDEENDDEEWSSVKI